MSMERLPLELLLCICEYVNPEDIKSLRLVSHRINDAAVHFVLPTVNVYLFEASLVRMNDISQHKLLRQHVRALNYYPLRIEPCGSVYNYKQMARESMDPSRFRRIFGADKHEYYQVPYEKWKKCLDEHERQREQQATLLGRRNIVAHMAHAFDLFPNLESITFARFQTYANPPRLVRQACSAGVMITPQGHCTHESTSILLAAARSSAARDVGSRIKFLELDFFTPFFFSSTNLAPFILTHIFTNLLTFKLTFSQPLQFTTPWIPDLLRCLNSCPHLEVLELIADEIGIHRSPFRPSAVNTLSVFPACPKIRRIKLRGFWLQQDSLYDFIVTRQPYLARVFICDCPLSGGQWGELYERVKEIFSITKRTGFHVLRGGVDLVRGHG